MLHGAWTHLTLMLVLVAAASGCVQFAGRHQNDSDRVHCHHGWNLHAVHPDSHLPQPLVSSSHKYMAISTAILLTHLAPGGCARHFLTSHEQQSKHCSASEHCTMLMYRPVHVECSQSDKAPVAVVCTARNPTHLQSFSCSCLDLACCSCALK